PSIKRFGEWTRSPAGDQLLREVRGIAFGFCASDAPNGIISPFKEFSDGQSGSFAIPERKCSRPSEREGHLRRTDLGKRKNDHSSRKNNVWLRCRCWHWRRWEYQQPRRRRWRWRRSASRSGRRDRSEQAADSFRAGFGPEKVS